MFETAGLPKHLAEHVAAMDEIWVSGWGGGQHQNELQGQWDFWGAWEVEFGGGWLGG